MNPQLAKRLIAGVGIAALVYLALAIFADWEQLRANLASFPWPHALLVLALSCLNYLVRFVRWELYLRRLNVHVQQAQSMRIFLCGLAMSITPGKLGELLKAYLVQQHQGTPVSRTAPIVIAERVTDLLALVVLILVGSVIYRTGFIAVVISTTVVCASIVMLSSERVAGIGLRVVAATPGLRRQRGRLESAYESVRFLIQPSLLVQSSLLGVVAWFAECVGFTVVLHGLGIDISTAYATFTYALSTVIGALLVTPGGVGGTEGSMITMLMAADVSKELAVASTFLIRIATLWFAVLLGAVVLLLNHRHEPKRHPEEGQLSTASGTPG